MAVKMETMFTFILKLVNFKTGSYHVVRGYLSHLSTVCNPGCTQTHGSPPASALDYCDYRCVPPPWFIFISRKGFMLGPYKELVIVFHYSWKEEVFSLNFIRYPEGNAYILISVFPLQEL